ncbi:uncharacterized protein TNCV_783601 [Trichonephila clavipes]|nr:uncharacterized protein TNCV_783601 [Trichonephila clavipes]
MHNSLSQMIPDMLDWRQIWGSGRPKKAMELHTITPAVGAFCHCKADRFEAFTMGSPHTNTIVITAEIESGFVDKEDLVPFRCSSVSLCAAPLQT